MDLLDDLLNLTYAWIQLRRAQVDTVGISTLLEESYIETEDYFHFCETKEEVFAESCIFKQCKANMQLIRESLGIRRESSNPRRRRRRRNDDDDDSSGSRVTNDEDVQQQSSNGMETRSRQRRRRREN